MGEDFNASDCSWKKMVIAKANDEWISTIKTERVEPEKMNANNFSIDVIQEPLQGIKTEREDPIAEPSYPDYLSDGSGIGHVDPLDTSGSHLLAPQRRKKGSVPKNETDEERAVRLAKMSAYAAQRLANETPEQRALRLKRMSEYAARRLSRESAEQRARRLQRMSAYAAQRLARETPEQRRVRLARMSAYAARRQSAKKRNSQSDLGAPPIDPMNLQVIINDNNMMSHQS